MIKRISIAELLKMFFTAAMASAAIVSVVWITLLTPLREDICELRTELSALKTEMYHNQLKLSSQIADLSARVEMSLSARKLRFDPYAPQKKEISGEKITTDKTN